MVKDIFDAFILNADRINFMVLLPHALSFLSGNDVSFETVTSSKIKTIKLYHKHNVATQSIGLVISHDNTYGNVVLCHKILKYGLKVDRVHTFESLSLSQLEEKITWVIEKIIDVPLCYARAKEQLALVFIINLGEKGLYLETKKN